MSDTVYICSARSHGKDFETLKAIRGRALNTFSADIQQRLSVSTPPTLESLPAKSNPASRDLPVEGKPVLVLAPQDILPGFIDSTSLVSLEEARPEIEQL